MARRISFLSILTALVILLPVLAGAGPAAGRGKPTAAECSDGIDNDGDGKVDFRPRGKGDPGCTSRNDETESDGSPPAEVCGDGADNDGDGLVDEGCGTGVLNETDTAAEADFCRVAPPTVTLSAGQSTQAYGQVFEDDVATTALPGADPSVVAQLGVGPAGSDPRSDAGWTYVPASYNAQLGSDDEYVASLVAPSVAGTYAFTYRFSFDSGSNFTYCDVGGAGSADGVTFDPADLSVMTVT